MGVSEPAAPLGAEHDLAKVGVEGSNPFARSNWFKHLDGIHLAG